MYPFYHDWSGVITQSTGEVGDVLGTVEESGWLKLEVTDILDRSAQDSIYVEVWDDMPVAPVGCFSSVTAKVPWDEASPGIG